MLKKLKIEGTIKIETGLHIGGSTEFAAIGAIDSPVIKDSLTNLPIIPGSSLKGKMRTLLAKAYNDAPLVSGTSANNDDYRIKRLFGATTQNEDGQLIIGRLIFRDSILSNKEKVDIFYGDRPVWIQEINNTRAKVGFVDDFGEQDVYIKDLYEREL